MMIAGRVSVALFTLYFVISIITTSEGRPRIRHHRGDSRCTKCAPGWGVSTACTPEKDTECSKCARGSYSPHHSLQPCWICSRCGPGLYEAHPCTSKTDTVCDSCHRHALDNADYHGKCKSHKSLFLAPEDAKSTGEESSLVNEDDDELNDNQEKEREIILAQDIEADLRAAQKHSMQRF
ncbi:tumor necrosis factor receptor superfamily member 5-like [Fopius arisanus]|uniref:Tumor necrosis factor receptor superfamily member 5-like n=1 Tax=Fopius arisanus TaxID=64838 RepID=A0A9R1SZ72_9HYME|nr:PREDICTED: tumor necrosis factor receptor superfamily member 5-like [Fopius arisanus]